MAMHDLAFMNKVLPKRLPVAVAMIECDHAQMLAAYDRHVLRGYSAEEHKRLIPQGAGSALENRVNLILFEEESDPESAARAVLMEYDINAPEDHAAFYAARSIFVACRSLYKNAAGTNGDVEPPAEAAVKSYRFLVEIIHQALKRNAQ
jgi:hypothetical protein